MKPGKLFLIPVPLHYEAGPSLTVHDNRAVKHIVNFIAENAKTARRHLVQLKLNTPIPELKIEQIDKHRPHFEQLQLLKPLELGMDVGLLSEAGCPAFADPGNVFVSRAHQLNAQVIPLAGPNALMLALMASGLNGQHFVFHGYLHKQVSHRIRQLKQLQQISLSAGAAHFFIETPFRNDQLIDTVLKHVSPGLRFCIAANLTSPNQFIKTMTINEWNKFQRPVLNKIPAIFGLGV